MEYITVFLQYLEYEKRYSRHTVDAYERDLLAFREFLSECKEEEREINFKSIRRWIVDLSIKKKSAKTVNRKIATLRSYFKYLMKRGLVESSPMEKVVALKSEKKMPVFVENEKLDELLDVKMTDVSDFESTRDKLLLELFYMTGMRLSELINLKDSDVDRSAMSVKVLGKRNKERIIPLPEPFCSRVESYIALKKTVFPDIDNLFVSNQGKPIYARWTQRLTAAKLSDVTLAKKRSPHVLRHSFATNMLVGGAELNAIKELLGHTNLSATQIYTHSSLNRIKKVYQQAHPWA